MNKFFHQACYINGKWVSADNQKTFEVFNPFDKTLLGTVPSLGVKETQAAIDAAHQAFPAWKNKMAKERAAILEKWFTLIMQSEEALAQLLTLEQGKPINEARGEIRYGASFIQWFAEEAKRVYGDIIPNTLPRQRLLVLKQPIGVVAAITPWNFPHAMITRKCAPALAAGCTVVLKASSETPFSALALADLAGQAGMPPGVLNVITGPAALIGEELTRHPNVKKLSFTGSTQVGSLLMAQCARSIKKTSLELGGNAPFIVFDDADLDAAAEGAMTTKFRNTGQTCVCANRLLVHDKIYDVFAEKLGVAIQKLKVGNGMDETSQQGPLINEKAVEKVESHIQDALEKGAKLALGGKRHALGSTFFEPTLLLNVSTKMKIAQEETFGPVAALFRFHDDKEALDIANNTDFGLASYFYTRDLARIFNVAENLEYGMVGVNVGLLSNEVAPFGGVKHSGIGREGSKYGIEDYLEIKYVCLGGLSEGAEK
ncbi:MAG: NAD-dependent succinate-semialdehyde dehydrogenase [Gammaproteobacteria bacterium]|nr:NAD-dependent succinate-semialdehyde dehydrogenase [Gammaproteobacteria bacterium]